MSHTSLLASHKSTGQRRLLPFLIRLIALLLASLIILSACTQPSSSQGHQKRTAQVPINLQDLQAIHMVNAATGWLWTQTRVGHTTNGGRIWQDVIPPQPAGTRLLALLGAYVFSGTQALVVTNFTTNGSNAMAIISRTRDGGRTWQSSVFPAKGMAPDPRMMSFINEQDGWAEVFYAGAAGNDLVAIFRTTDGGKTWVPLSQTPIGSVLLSHVPTTFPFSGHKAGLTFVNASTGWAAVFTDGILKLFVTHDGGVTWQGRTLSLPANELGFFMLPPTFFTAHNGIVPIDFQFQTTPGSGKQFLVTHDGGASWQATTPIPAYGGVVDVLDMAHVWVAVAQGSDLYRSSDGAQHWQKMTPTLPVHITRFAQLDFISPATGWAIGLQGSDANPKTVLLKTTTGGQTWTIASDQ